MKVCLDCGIEFVQRGQNHKRCDICARKKNLATMKQWHKDNVVTGEGSGSKTGKGVDNPMFKHGLNVFRRWAKERLQELSYCCERCGETIDNSRRGSWAGHHKDHNRQNNTKDNLEVLCKRCHQIEHECWTAFQGVTTIVRDERTGRYKRIEAHSPEASGDDIVCST